MIFRGLFCQSSLFTFKCVSCALEANKLVLEPEEGKIPRTSDACQKSCLEHLS